MCRSATHQLSGLIDSCSWGREGGEEEEGEEPPGYCEEAAAALYVFIYSAVESTPKYLIVNVPKQQKYKY